MDKKQIPVELGVMLSLKGKLYGLVSLLVKSRSGVNRAERDTAIDALEGVKMGLSRGLPDSSVLIFNFNGPVMAGDIDTMVNEIYSIIKDIDEAILVNPSNEPALQPKLASVEPDLFTLCKDIYSKHRLSLAEFKMEIGKQYARAAFAHHQHNKSVTAGGLGISLTWMRRMLSSKNGNGDSEWNITR